jgi:hypothetical protein
MQYDIYLKKGDISTVTVVKCGASGFPESDKVGTVTDLNQNEYGIDAETADFWVQEQGYYSKEI